MRIDHRVRPAMLGIMRIPLIPLLATLFATLCHIHAEPTAHDFAKWEKEISAFEKQDSTSPSPKGGVIFTGASSIRMWTSLAKDFPKTQPINRGFGLAPHDGRRRTKKRPSTNSSRITSSKLPGCVSSMCMT
jgi:hypothetical protein